MTLPYTYSATVGGTPAAGEMRFNNANYGAATQLLVSLTDAAGNLHDTNI